MAIDAFLSSVMTGIGCLSVTLMFALAVVAIAVLAGHIA